MRRGRYASAASSLGRASGKAGAVTGAAAGRTGAGRVNTGRGAVAMQPAPLDEAALGQALARGADSLGLALTNAQLQQLCRFAALLHKWNAVYNLTALRDIREVVTHHLLDSLAAVPALLRHVAGLPEQPGPRRLLDVGSGGGLPAVVFAIVCPALQVHCVDAVAKKAAFIQQVGASLGLPNLRSLHARVQDVQRPVGQGEDAAGYDIISSRAFASLADFTAWSCHALKPGGVWLALKGKTPGDEMDAVDARVARVFHVEPLQVPGLDASRCLVWMRAA